MKLTVNTDQPWAVRADVLVVPLAATPTFDGVLAEIDRRSGGGISASVGIGEVSGKRFATSLLAGGELGSRWVLTVGIGPVGDIDREVVVHTAAAVLRRLGGRKVRTVAYWLDEIPSIAGGFAGVAELVARGVVEGSSEPATIYREKVDSAPPALDELILIATGASDTGAIAAGAERGRIIGEGSNWTRRLANRAANDVTPEVMAEEARALAKQHDLWIDVIEPERAQKLGMGMFLAVGKGSDNPPRMIVVRSGGEGEKDALGRHLALVGKGVCFDSGGISIKPADRMEEMKMDKTGACTVLGAIATVARLAPGTPLMAVAPAVENMPGPHSTRPGDLVKALNGKWVDITNTDAEGRLILGDAMTYAERLGATHLVDVATLTGAVGRSLGHLVAGGFGAPQAFYDDVMAAARQAGERFWQLPLVDEYLPDLESWYGDIVNSGTVEGSLVKSAIFLREFVTRPWVHLDIASTAYFRKTLPWAPRGATGMSHATLVELAMAGARPDATGERNGSRSKVGARAARPSAAGSAVGAGTRRPRARA